MTSSNSSLSENNILNNDIFSTDILRREINHVTGVFALCFCTFVSPTYIVDYIYEKVNTPKLNSESSSSSNSSSSLNSNNPSSDKIDSKKYHEEINKKVKSLLWSKTNSSVSSNLVPNTYFEPGDYTIGVMFEKESDAVELSSITFNIKHKIISNFYISQMLTQFFRASGFSPSQLLQLPIKSEGETISINQKIREDTKKILKSIENVATIASSNNGSNNNSINASTVSCPGNTNLSINKEFEEINRKINQIDEKCTHIGEKCTHIDEKCTHIDEKCNETNYLIKEPARESIKEQGSNSMNSANPINLINPINEELNSLKEVFIKSNQELLNKFSVIEKKMKCFSEDIPVVTVSDIIELTRQRNNLLNKLTEAENFIESIEEIKITKE